MVDSKCNSEIKCNSESKCNSDSKCNSECYYCKSPDIVEDRRNGEIVCSKCGTVQTTFVLDDRQPLKKRRCK